MRAQFLLSFIIPVYNVEQYLEECIDSILSQVDGRCEIILVDDGSTDGSGAICDRYDEAHDCITVIHKTNGGSFSARNAGIECAQGNYVAFVDSDDRIAEGSISQLLAWAEDSKTDICFLEAVKLFSDGSKQSLGDAINPDKVRGAFREKIFEHLADRPKYPGSACTKLFRTRFLLDNNFRFPKRKYGEDLSFTRDCLLSAETVDALSMPYYEYRQNREGSITHIVSAKSFFDLVLFVRETVEKTTVQKRPKDAVCKCAMSFAAYEYAILLRMYNRLEPNSRKPAKEFLREYQWVLQYGRTRRLALVRLVEKLFGIGGGSKILNLYKPRK